MAASAKWASLDRLKAVTKTKSPGLSGISLQASDADSIHSELVVVVDENAGGTMLLREGVFVEWFLIDANGNWKFLSHVNKPFYQPSAWDVGKIVRAIVFDAKNESMRLHLSRGPLRLNEAVEEMASIKSTFSSADGYASLNLKFENGEVVSGVVLIDEDHSYEVELKNVQLVEPNGVVFQRADDPQSFAEFSFATSTERDCLLLKISPPHLHSSSAILPSSNSASSNKLAERVDELQLKLVESEAAIESIKRKLIEKEEECIKTVEDLKTVFQKEEAKMRAKTVAADQILTKDAERAAKTLESEEEISRLKSRLAECQQSLSKTNLKLTSAEHSLAEQVGLLNAQHEKCKSLQMETTSLISSVKTLKLENERLTREASVPRPSSKPAAAPPPKIIRQNETKTSHALRAQLNAAQSVAHNLTETIETLQEQLEAQRDANRKLAALLPK